MPVKLISASIRGNIAPQALNYIVGGGSFSSQTGICLECIFNGPIFDTKLFSYAYVKPVNTIRICNWL